MAPSKPTLLACIGEGKGTWGPVARVINDADWARVFIVTTTYFSDKFKTERAAEMIVIDKDKGLPQMVEELQKGLDGKMSGDVCVNLMSGTGKEHMALISSLRKLGVSYRLVAQGKEGVEDI